MKVLGRRVVVSILAGTMMAGALLVATVSEIHAPLRTAIASVLTAGVPEQDPGLLVIVDGPPSDVGKGIAITLLCVFLGGPVTATIGIGLGAYSQRRERRWPSAWATVLQAAFVFQLCSLALWLLSCLVLAAVLLEWGPLIACAVLLVGGLFVGLNVLGLRAWRALQADVAPAVHSIMVARHL